MEQTIDINEIKQYNASLKEYREKSSQLKAEIDYTNKEIDELCAELSAELGTQVTRDNIEQIYNEQVNKIKTSLQAGQAVLAKIAGAQANTDVEQPSIPQVEPSMTPPMTPEISQAAPVNEVASSEVPIQPQVDSGIPSAPIPPTGNVFNTNNVLPPMFSM